MITPSQYQRESIELQEMSSDEEELDELRIVDQPSHARCHKQKVLKYAGMATILLFVIGALIGRNFLNVKILVDNPIKQNPPVNESTIPIGITTYDSDNGYFGTHCKAELGNIGPVSNVRIATWNLMGWGINKIIALRQGEALQHLEADFIATQENMYVFEVLEGLGSDYCFVGEGRDDHECPCPTEVPLTSDAGGSQEHVALYWNTKKWQIIDTATVFLGNFKYSRIYTRGVFRRSSASSLTIQNPGTGYCLDVYSASQDNGANIQLYECNGSGAQQWRWEGTSLVNINSGKCLDSDGQNDGANIHQWECSNENSHQQWELYSDNDFGTILRNIANGLCIDIAGGVAEMGSNIQLHDCIANNQAQQWTITGESEIEVTVISIHLPTRKQPESQENCINQIISYVEPLISTKNIILIGDWNVEEPDVEERFQPLIDVGLGTTSDQLCNNCNECHEGFDKAFTNMMMTSANCNMDDMYSSSDHFPVIVEVTPIH